MKVAVYDRYWDTYGGAEQYAGTVAEMLALTHDVELLSFDDVDLGALEGRLGLDLSRVMTRTIKNVGALSIAEATGDADLLINCTYMSAEFSGAARAVYIVSFPTPFEMDISRLRKIVRTRLGPHVRQWVKPPQFLVGFYDAEGGRISRFRWTNGEGVLRLPENRPPGKDLLVKLRPSRPWSLNTIDVEAKIEGAMPVRAKVGQRSVTLRIPVPLPHDCATVDVILRSPIMIPRDVLGTDDRRDLGVRVAGVSYGGRFRDRLIGLFPGLFVDSQSLDFLDSYDVIIANSQFTRSWIRRLWGRDAVVVYPPVRQISPGEKAPLILSVGRFFADQAAHSKKQFEMVRAFRRLVDQGLSGWEYHLVGGCAPEHQRYLDRVRAEARGLPVVFHINAPRAELEKLCAKASVFWHATGLGEDEQKHPHRFEHFGITTVEAMSAGAVPIVIAKAGQVEIVSDGANGLHFTTMTELVERTLSLVGDPDRLSALSAAARQRAAEFAPERFKADFGAVIDELISDQTLAN